MNETVFILGVEWFFESEEENQTVLYEFDTMEDLEREVKSLEEAIEAESEDVEDLVSYTIYEAKITRKKELD